MVRFKNRYVVLEVNPNKQSEQHTFSLKSNSLYSAIQQKVQQLHGDFGIAAIRSGFVAKYCNEITRIALIRVRHGPHRFVTSSLPFITYVDSKPVSLNTLYTGATIKQCYNFIIEYQKTKLIETLSSFKTETEKENFRNALMNLDSVVSML